MSNATMIEGEVISTMDHGYMAGIVIETYTPYHQQVPIALCDAPDAAPSSSSNLIQQLIEALGLERIEDLLGEQVTVSCGGKSAMPGMLATTPDGVART